MNKFKKMMNKVWFANLVTGVILILIYLLLSKFKGFSAVVDKLVYYFSPLIAGCIIAYLMNTLAVFFEKKVFRAIKKDKLRWGSSVVVTVITVLVLIVLILLMLIPQLVKSVQTFIGNLDTYAAHLNAWMESTGLAGKYIDPEVLTGFSDKIIDRIVDYSGTNMNKIISASATAGKSVFGFFIAFVLSVYLLLSKRSLKAGLLRFMRAVMQKAHFRGLSAYLSRANDIVTRYVIFNILDSLIIGGINAVFMAICRMDYIGLVSVIVGVTNLIPTFGPMIGLVIGGFVLLMINPIYALIFIIFTFVLQSFDSYVLKPRLFGNSLGVSGLLVLLAVIIGGRIAGVPGILISIPLVAILDFTYKDYLLPKLEEGRKKRNARKDSAGAADTEDGDADDSDTEDVDADAAGSDVGDYDGSDADAAGGDVGDYVGGECDEYSAGRGAENASSESGEKDSADAGTGK